MYYPEPHTNPGLGFLFPCGQATLPEKIASNLNLKPEINLTSSGNPKTLKPKPKTLAPKLPYTPKTPVKPKILNPDPKNLTPKRDTPILYSPVNESPCLMLPSDRSSTNTPSEPPVGCPASSKMA